MPRTSSSAIASSRFLLPPDVREWLPNGHLTWFILSTVAELDLADFYAAYRTDGHGRAAYEPSMMVALVLCSYARGVRSSRAIERACEEDIAFRVLAANQKPDHATLARFIERHEEALAGLSSPVRYATRATRPRIDGSHLEAPTLT
jgi:transposase